MNEETNKINTFITETVTRQTRRKHSSDIKVEGSIYTAAGAFADTAVPDPPKPFLLSSSFALFQIKGIRRTPLSSSSERNLSERWMALVTVSLLPAKINYIAMQWQHKCTSALITYH